MASAPAARAQDFETPRSIGLSQAQRALATSNDAVYLNPGGLALGNLYSIELGYVDDGRGSDRRLNASVVDSQAGSIAAGIAYTYMKRRPEELAAGDERLEGHRVDVALATRVSDTAALGVSGRYLSFERKNGDTELEGGFKQFTMDAGIMWRVVGGLSLGVAGYNLFNSKRAEIPIGWGAGLGYALDALTIEADVRYNAQRGEPTYSGGAGYVIAGTVPLRAGFTYELATKAVSLSAGLGFTFDRFTLDLGYRQRVNGERVEEDDDHRLLGAALRGSLF